MKINRIRTVLILILCLGIPPVIPARALAGEATEQVRQTVDSVLEVLRDKELKKPEKKEQRRKKIREIIDRRFDFEEMAKRSLSLHWKDRKPEERKEFVSLFSDLLQNTYIIKIERYEDEKVAYTDERLDGEYALVKTRIVSSKGADVPVDYKIFKKEGKWQVYDILVEGVSLVNNYRSQFSQIIRSGSYEELVRRLRDKTVK